MNQPVQQRIAAAPSTVGIETLESLREHLQCAIELEHATLPPYLCALYSLDPSRNPEAVQVVGSVFVEEMIHLALAASLLDQAFNGSPKMLGIAIGTMYALKAQAQSLMELDDGDGTTAGPTFEYVDPEHRR